MDLEYSDGSKGPIQLDVAAILSSRLGRRSRWVPRMLIRRLERLICQNEMNEMLRVSYPRRNSEFCRAVMDHLNIKIEIKDIENMPDRNSTRVIFVSNHPLGGLDGMALIDFIANYYGCEPLFIINDLLMAIEPLRDVFVPVNKHGSQSRSTLAAIDEAMKGSRPVIIFPAGLCSRKRDGQIKDLEWQKMFVQKARQWNRDIVPLRFNARNSDNFYKWANRREGLGIKFNAEMILLPGEVFKSRGKTFSISVGKPISVASLSNDYRKETERIRNIVDSMATDIPSK